MTNNKLEENSKSISLQAITIDDPRNEASTSNAIDSIINLSNESRASSLSNLNVSRDTSNHHSKLYNFFFKRFTKDKNNTLKYAKLENSVQPEIQSSSVYDIEEAIASSSNHSARNLVNKLNKNLQNNVNRLINNPKPKETVINLNTRDGVFSNLNEKPEIRSTRLPTYYEVTGEYANELDDPNIEVSIGQDIDDFGELLINDLQVGSWYSFWGTIIVSAVLEFIGFIFTFFLTSTHSAKDGSIVGLGIILYKYALCNAPVYDLWFIIFLIVLGTILCVKGTRDFRKTKRIEKLVNSDPERYLEPNNNY
ncbi:hypothetical protein H8356DRAFT_1290350 [Neocallimastix lanati (nom. inval.)]|jgi:hypothetical protein|uniref:Uncharacterized protein n=1 Tax=Neocallimastix californiae TaxID=1754190 RepID=A0A1Y2EUR9_9FUNG|nr:hypothetical protein H8356DRAFT_1290350 [Neocallimastix sp. JGI-2020a]ORY74906.1 hypothetical protein LY90DRAFT_666038 [Neocallimastix californiae]|eukprot:ORY74906.1 hypothetical protein LY90DRAFT_666038 [Neocallimastix californiae]